MGNSRDADKFVVRLPDGMRTNAEEAARDMHTSMNTFFVQAIEEKLARGARQQLLLDALQLKLAQPAEKPAALDLDEELRYILGRPNFTCIATAQCLRAMGHEIASKAEDEQATVIHWMLGHYLRHGDAWRKHAAAELEAAQQKAATA